MRWYDKTMGLCCKKLHSKVRGCCFKLLLAIEWLFQIIAPNMINWIILINRSMKELC